MRTIAQGGAMFCANCGKEHDGQQAYCDACGAPLAAPAVARHETAYREQVPNHLVWAILATLFCCLPAGIVAIVYAAQVNGKLDAGDIAGARAASANAKTWSWISFGVGIVVFVGFFGLGLVGGLA